MNLSLYNSLSRTKELFKPLVDGEVSLYVCGPTVYDSAHLGHAKSALSFDLLVRLLEELGYRVTYARNITDIDNKIIQKASKSNISIDELTSRYIKQYEDEMRELGVKKPTLEPRATESLDAMYELIQRLIDKGHAYKTQSGDVYFDISSDPKYLSISKREQDSSDLVARVQSSTHKRNSADFALWKAVDDESISYESPFSRGRPGWHTECSAMIEKIFPNTDGALIDIHGGGADLLFPHHENEATQCRCSTGKELANYWMHNGFVNIDNQKMSKSLGNSFFLKDALKSYSGELLRLYLLSTHYRANFNFNIDDLHASKKRLDRLYRLKEILFAQKVVPIKTEFQKNLLEALCDDMNVSKALSYIDEMLSSASLMLEKNPKNKQEKQKIIADLDLVKRVFGLGVLNPYEYFQHGVDEKLKKRIEALIASRNEAKKSKDFVKSDAIRDEILALGVQLKDTAAGTFWQK